MQRVDRQAVERARLLRPQPKPVHAGVDHHVARAARGRFPATARPARRVEHRARGDCSARRRHRARRRAARPIQRRPASRPSASASAQVETKKSRQPASASASTVSPRAKPIAVGLDRRPRSRPGAILQPAPVGLERGAVERQAKRVVHCAALSPRLFGRVEAGAAAAPSSCRRTPRPPARRVGRGNGR